MNFVNYSYFKENKKKFYDVYKSLKNILHKKTIKILKRLKSNKNLILCNLILIFLIFSYARIGRIIFKKKVINIQSNYYISADEIKRIENDMELGLIISKETQNHVDLHTITKKEKDKIINDISNTKYKEYLNMRQSNPYYPKDQEGQRIGITSKQIQINNAKFQFRSERYITYKEGEKFKKIKRMLEIQKYSQEYVNNIRNSTSNFDRLFLSPIFGWLFIIIIPIIYLSIEKKQINIKEYCFFLMYFSIIIFISTFFLSNGIGYYYKFSNNTQYTSLPMFIIDLLYCSYEENLKIYKVYCAIKFILKFEILVGIILSLIFTYNLKYFQKNIGALIMIFSTCFLIILLQLIIQYQHLDQDVKFK